MWGGNTANLLAVWRLTAWTRPARRLGARHVLAGVSAGALLVRVLRDGLLRRRVGPLHDGLGLLPGSFCPHYDGEA